MSKRPLLTRAEFEAITESSYNDDQLVPETSDMEDEDGSDAATGDLTTDMNWAASQSSKPVRLPLADHVQSAAKMRVQAPRFDYADELSRYGYMRLVDVVAVEEDCQDQLAAWRQSLLPLLAGIPFDLLYHALHGTLAEECLGGKNKDVCGLLDCEHYADDKNWQQETSKPDTPAIYMRAFADSKGRGPSARQMLKITRLLRQYVSGDRAAHQNVMDIDNSVRVVVSQKDTEGGYRVFLAGKESRAELVLTWCAAVEMSCNSVNLGRMDEPLPPHNYCGYSSRVSERLGQYERGVSTTWLKLLFEAAARVALPEHRFYFHSFTVAYMARHEEVPLAERFFTRCLSAKVEQGGFCVAPAGQCSSAKKITDDRWSELWEFRYKYVRFDEQCMEEAERIRAAPRPAKGQSEAEYEAELHRRIAAADERLQKAKAKVQKDMDEIMELAEQLSPERRAEVLADMEGWKKHYL
jgi:hypothetical protein